MKHIEKTAAPTAFLDWKIRHGASLQAIGQHAKLLWQYWGHNHEGVKPILKEHLLADQGYICCYCMQRVVNDSSTVIEHLTPKTNDPLGLTFDFGNLLASCHGEGKTPRPKEMHCDGSKKAQQIFVSPLDTTCEQAFQFTLAGEVLAVTPNAQTTIAILGLDIKKLKNLREAAIDQELAETQTREEAERRVMALRQKSHTGYFTPFCITLMQVLIQEFSL